jgi:hypothetical protein
MHEADKLAQTILATAQSVADLTHRDPRTVKRDEKPVAILQTPQGQRPLYSFDCQGKPTREALLAQDLLEAAERNSKD